ncbi:MAG TPA: lamin tail domain-containing protein, partial [Verrucomicrobiales bacterium]|nr:lamin tail domain-containing protein [Verrucomicrobiales bacterium]
ATTYYYRCYAENAAGSAWATSSLFFATFAGPPIVANVAATDILATSATVGANLTSNGGSTANITLFYGPADGGVNPAGWASSVPLGTQTGITTTSLTGLTASTAYYFRVRAVNTNATSWAPSSASFTTPAAQPPAVVNQAPTGVTIFWATLRGQVTNTGNAPTDVTIYWGTTDGGTTPAAWQHADSVGIQTGSFSKLASGLSPSTTYYYRAKAVNAAGTAWAPSSQSFTTPATSPLELVINEIHCDHEDKTLRVEFVELYNPGASAVDLAGWHFDQGIDFSFPAGASIPAGGYAVVAENPAVLQSTYGYAGAYGPWTGALQANGETITLRNPAGEVADEVDYGAGYPWPTVGVTPNYSLELLNPSLDNSLGGNWRAKGGSATVPDVVLQSAASTAWRFRRGNKPAPAADWMQPSYVEDAGNWENGTTTYDSGTGFYKGIGYGDTDDATVLSDMQGVYRSVYLRHTFNVSAGDLTGSIKLRIYVDDGAVVYLNGQEVPARFHVQAGVNPGHNGAGITVDNHEASPNTWDELIIPNTAAWLHAGENLIAIHAMDVAASSDFSINSEVRRTSTAAGASPTPGAANSVFSANAGPATRQVEHVAQNPVIGQTAMLPGQAVLITVKVTDPDGVQSVNLLYQTVDPGSYIKLEDAAYENAASWTTLPMVDTGTGPDLIAGDSIYTALIPAAVQTHRRLVRYRITATDGLGATVRVPYSDDPAPNFAYFVYGNMPDYTGAINPTGAASYTGGVIPSHTNTQVTYSAAMLKALPVYHLITTRQNHVDAQFLPGTTLGGGYRGDESTSATDEQSYPWRGTIVYDGKVHDHIRFRARGGVWRYSMGKNMWKFDMTRGHDFQTRDNYGLERDEKWKKINFSACIQQGDFLSRGEQGMYEAVGFRLFQLSGMPGNHTNWVHFRIIENASESGPTATQYDDDFQGLYLALEQEDGQFLKEHGLPDGNLYKMEGGTGELNNQGPTLPGNKSDLNTFLSYGNTEAWWRQNTVLPNYYNYRAIIDCIHHYDIGDGKNYFYFHYPVDPLDPNSNKWQPAVWDLDLTWADNMYRADSGIAGLPPSGNSTEPFFSRVYNIVPLRTEVRNRDREVLDLLFNQEQTGMLIDELASFIYQPGQPSFVDADRAMWDYNPIMVSAQINSSKAGRGRFYQSAVDDPTTAGTNETGTFPGMLQKMRNYITTRRNVITAQILTDESAVPAKPVVTRAGGSQAFPTNDLTFNVTAFSSPSGRPFGKMKWRIAEITNPAAPGYNRWDHTVERKYEADPKNTWESPEITTFNNTFTFPASAAHSGRTYRVRAKFADTGDTAGSGPRWGHWSDPVTFTTTAPDVTVYLNSLVVSEIMYHPRSPSGAELNVSVDDNDFEYVVVMNAGATTLDMTNIRFTKGIDFDFSGSSVTSLAPGERAVVVKNLAAFNVRYAAGLGSIRVAGAWQGNDNLSNAGEELKLSFGAGTPVREFSYDDEVPWPVQADGEGYSLVLIAPWTIPNHTLPESWRLSAGLDGSPGRYDGTRLADWKASHGNLTDLGDGDRDGLNNLLEYTLLGDPAVSSQSPLPVAVVEGSASEPGIFLTLTARIARGADDVVLIPEHSNNLNAWDATPAAVVLESATADANGGTTYKWRSTQPWSASVREYLRLRVQTR